MLVNIGQLKSRRKKAGNATPSTPTILYILNYDATSLVVLWQALHPNPTNYYIERSLNGTTGWTLVQTNPGAGNADNWVNSGLTNGVTYYYRMRASNDGVVFSGYSNVASNVAQVIAAPTGLVAIDQSWNQFDLTWTNHYLALPTGQIHIERSPASPGDPSFLEIGQVNGLETSYSDYSAYPNETFTYRIRVDNTYAYSSYNTAASVTLADPSVLPAVGPFSGLGSVDWNPLDTQSLNFLGSLSGYSEAAPFMLKTAVWDNSYGTLDSAKDFGIWMWFNQYLFQTYQATQTVDGVDATSQAGASGASGGGGGSGWTLPGAGGNGGNAGNNGADGTGTLNAGSGGTGYAGTDSEGVDWVGIASYDYNVPSPAGNGGSSSFSSNAGTKSSNGACAGGGGGGSTNAAFQTAGGGGSGAGIQVLIGNELIDGGYGGNNRFYARGGAGANMTSSGGEGGSGGGGGKLFIAVRKFSGAGQIIFDVTGGLGGSGDLGNGNNGQDGNVAVYAINRQNQLILMGPDSDFDFNNYT